MQVAESAKSPSGVVEEEAAVEGPSSEEGVKDVGGPSGEQEEDEGTREESSAVEGAGEEEGGEEGEGEEEEEEDQEGWHELQEPVLNLEVSLW